MKLINKEQILAIQFVHNQVLTDLKKQIYFSNYKRIRTDNHDFVYVEILLEK